MRPILYSPSGNAGEYADKGFALNHYLGCDHGCGYCYGPSALHTTREAFSEPRPAPDALERLEADLKRLTHDGPLPDCVFMSFATDPYNELEKDLLITRDAIELIHSFGCRVRILTKNGCLAQRDIPMLLPGDEFGVSLTCSTNKHSALWEPGASAPVYRIHSLRAAFQRGIKTWVSMEPVIYPEQTVELIKRTTGFVDCYKIGVLNHTGRIDPDVQKCIPLVDWVDFGCDVVALLEAVRTYRRGDSFVSPGGHEFSYYIKEDLRNHLPGHITNQLDNGWRRG